MLVADLYELTMAAGYCRRGMAAPATFSLFARALPPSRGFLVASGVDEALDRIAAWEVGGADIDQIVDSMGWPPELLAPLKGRRFTGEAWAVTEGSVVLANEPLLELTAPLPEAQLLETTVLNAITYQTALATKAARCRLAARGRPIIDFSFRRTHGVEAGLAAARAGGLVGFAATSNVAAAGLFGLRAAGTMAHSFVQAFPGEQEAFDAFAEDFPATPTFLVDTYDTARGVERAIRVIRTRGLDRRAAVRLDSGNLAAEAGMTRAQLDAAGLSDVRIVVSGGLDEYEIDHLLREDAPIDVFAVGTRVGTASDAPLLDTAYKLVEYDGQPITKLSAGKGYAPGPKQVWRSSTRPDVLATRTEPAPRDAEAQLRPAIRDGRRLRPAATVAQARRRFEGDLAWLPRAALDLHDPVPAQCRLSPVLEHLQDAVRAGYRAGGETSPAEGT